MPTRFTLTLALLALAGCGGSKLPPLFPVSGAVTLNGQPLALGGGTGSVQFVPDNSKGTTGVASVAGLSPDGRYELSTPGANNKMVKGVPAGHYKIRIDARAAPKNEMDTMPASLIPTSYNNPDSSGFTFEVKPGGPTTFDLPLVSQPAAP